MTVTETLGRKVLAGGQLTKKEAMTLYGQPLEELCTMADTVRARFHAQAFSLCTIVNGKSGRCTENCRFCAQSAHYHTEAAVYPLCDQEEILAQAKRWQAQGVPRFGIVTAGRRLSGREVEEMCRTIRRVRRETEISHYGSGEALLADWRPGAFELVVLDIYMGGATGMEVARRLRADDGQVRLAFATSSNDFASESYEVGACYYLRKPFRPEGVRAMLERLDLEALERSRRLRLPDGSQVVLRSIRYAASDGHRVTLHCKDGDRTLRTSFAAVEPLLCAYPCFCGICRGVVVNFHEVAGRQEDVFLLKDGTRLPISRRRLREVQEAYSAFRFDRLRKDGVD